LKILIITTRIPYPPFRGDKLKIFNISKQLSVRNSVTILTFYRNKKQLKDKKVFDSLGIEIKFVKLSIIESLYHTFLAIFGSLPFQTAFYKSNKMKLKVESEIKNNNYDVVYYHLIRSAQYLFRNSHSATPLNIIDYTDAVSLYLNRLSQIEKNFIKRYFIKIEQRRVEQYELIAEKFDSLFICSKIDRDFLQKRGIKINIDILVNGVDVDFFNEQSCRYDSEKIIFTGNMPYYANYDAAIYFAKEIFPKILQKIPNAKFYITGQKPPRKIKSLASHNIYVTGFVENLKAEYLNSAVNVAPMRFGAGTLNKVIESIALGVPVVATTMAVSGLPEGLDKYIFVADSTDDFAQKVIDVMTNPNIRLQLIEEGKKNIREILSWEKIVSDFENYLLSELEKTTSLQTNVVKRIE